MNVNLGPKLDSFVAEMVKSGNYQTQSEVLRDGLRLLKERETLKRLRIEELRREIAIGTEQLERGQFVDGPKAMAKLLRKAQAGARRTRR